MVSSVQPYFCRFSSGGIRMKGDLADPVWQESAKLEFFLPGNLEQPQSRTEGRLLWDEEYLYVGMKAFDKDRFEHIREDN